MFYSFNKDDLQKTDKPLIKKDLIRENYVKKTPEQRRLGETKLFINDNFKKLNDSNSTLKDK